MSNVEFAEGWVKSHQHFDECPAVLRDSKDTPEGKLNYFKWRFGPFAVDGEINTTNLDAKLTTYLQLPVVGKATLGSSVGNLKDGITSSFNIPQAKGSIKIFTQNNFIRLTLDATFMNNKYDKTFTLFSIPSPGQNLVPHTDGSS